MRILALALTAASFLVHAAPPLAVDQKAAAKYDFTALRARLEKAVASQEIPGGSVLVMHQGKVIFKEAFGMIDLERKMPFKTDSVCALASTTKWVSGATLMAAVEDGKVALDDKIGKYFPIYAEMPVTGTSQVGSPTLRQCFAHTGGLGQIALTDFIILRNNSVLDSVTLLAPMMKELEWTPGANFRYGNTGMQFVGGAIAKVSGMEFQDYMEKKILGPLGMTETTFNPKDDLLKRVGSVYMHKQGGGFAKIAARPPDGNIRGAIVAGGLYSTLDDYARFLTMMLNDGKFEGRKILSAKSALETQKDQTAGVPIKASPYRDQKGYGLGAAVMGTDGKGKPVYIGDGGAYGTYGWIERDAGIAAIFFTQNQLRDIYRLSTVEVRDLVRAAVDAAKH